MYVIALIKINGCRNLVTEVVLDVDDYNHMHIWIWKQMCRSFANTTSIVNNYGYFAD